MLGVDVEAVRATLALQQKTGPGLERYRPAWRGSALRLVHPQDDALAVPAVSSRARRQLDRRDRAGHAAVDASTAHARRSHGIIEFCVCEPREDRLLSAAMAPSPRRSAHKISAATNSHKFRSLSSETRSITFHSATRRCRDVRSRAPGTVSTLSSSPAPPRRVWPGTRQSRSVAPKLFLAQDLYHSVRCSCPSPCTWCSRSACMIVLLSRASSQHGRKADNFIVDACTTAAIKFGHSLQKIEFSTKSQKCRSAATTLSGRQAEDSGEDRAMSAASSRMLVLSSTPACVKSSRTYSLRPILPILRLPSGQVVAAHPAFVALGAELDFLGYPRTRCRGTRRTHRE